MLKKISTLLACLVLLTGVFALTACDQTTETNVLDQPVNFTYNTDTGEFSFTATDEETGFYFVRAYPYNPVTKKEGVYAIASSERIAGSSTGAKSGSLDVSSFGWGQYKVKLISFVASGIDKDVCDPVVVDCVYGLDGTLEKPEFRWTQKGTTVVIEFDWFNLRDWYIYQFLPLVDFNFYSDAACTSLVKSERIDPMDLLDYVDRLHSAELSYIWHLPHNRYEFTLNAGTYYFKMVTVSTVDGIEASKESDVCEIFVPSSQNYSGVGDYEWPDENKFGADGDAVKFWGTTAGWKRYNIRQTMSGPKYYSANIDYGHNDTNPNTEAVFQGNNLGYYGVDPDTTARDGSPVKVLTKGSNYQALTWELAQPTRSKVL